MEQSIKELYREQLINEHYKPMLWLKCKLELSKQIAKQEAELKVKGFTDTQLDKIFNEAKQDVQAMLKELN